MVLTIAPAGSGAVRTLAKAHAAGLALGAVIAGLALVLIGAGLREAAPGADEAIAIAIGVLALLWLPRTLGSSRGVRWPRSRWQVPEQWRYRLPLPVTLFAFGVLLGVGVLTSPVFPVLWVLFGLTLASKSVALTLVAWLVYAGTRAALTVVAARRVTASGAIPDDVHGARGLRWGRGMSGAVLLAVGGYAAALVPATSF
jgi:hypothetical protein